MFIYSYLLSQPPFFKTYVKYALGVNTKLTVFKIIRISELKRGEISNGGFLEDNSLKK